MGNNTTLGNATRSYKNLEEALNTVLSEDTSTIQDVKYRWEKTFHSIFSSLSSTFSRYFVSRIKSDNVTCIQSSIQRAFQKNGYVERIKIDADLQNSFLLGYCHASEQFVNSFESLISHEQDESLKSALVSYKHMKPILLCLDKNFQMSHKELAKHIGISDSALSNFMAKVQKYGIFNSVHAGKNKYYTLAYPNGEKALKLAKSYGVSPLDYTDFLLKLLDLMQDAASDRYFIRNEVLEECHDMIFRYTTKPTVCMEKIRNLFEHLHPKKASCVQLLAIEFNVKESVTIFTKNIRSEQVFMDVVAHNLKRNIRYDWFICKSEEFNSEKKIIDYLLEQLLTADSQLIIDNIRICIIPEQEMKSLLGNNSDGVLYDEEIAYSSNDADIKLESEYKEDDKPQQLIEYKSEHKNSLQNINAS